MTFALLYIQSEWIQPPLPLAHPLDDGTAVVMDRSVQLTAGNLGPGHSVCSSQEAVRNRR
jgi:hypothetical protein